MTAAAPGTIVILNGSPRSGKSSIVAAIQESFDGPWMNLGVDSYWHVTPPRFRPGIGLRPGGEAPALEPWVELFYAALYESIAAHSRLGLNVVAEFGHHDGYTRPLGILADSARRLAGLPVLFVGVRCPIEVILERRRAGDPTGKANYEVGAPGGPVPPPVQRYQDAVHVPGIYDMELDGAKLSPQESAALIRRRLDAGIPSPSAFDRLRATAR